MLCPVCRIDLRQTDLGEHGLVVLDVCPECEGAWFDKGELDRLDEAIWVNVEERSFHEVEGDHKGAECPKCSVSLDPISPDDEQRLIVDRCPSCKGFWLDRGELERVAEVAGRVQAELSQRATLVQKPADWSLLRWWAYNLKAYYGRKG